MVRIRNHGPGVSMGIRVGDVVLSVVMPRGTHGAYAEQVVLDARSVVRVPAGSSFVEACTLPMNGLTARQSLDLLNPSHVGPHGANLSCASSIPEIGLDWAEGPLPELHDTIGARTSLLE